MKDIFIKAEGWRLSPDWAVAGTKGSARAARLVFDLSQEWDGLALRATFFPEGGAVSVIMEDATVVIPAEVTEYAGNSDFVIDGVGADGVKLVSARGTLRVVDTACPGGKVPRTPTPDELEALRLELYKLRADIEELKNERKRG